MTLAEVQHEVDTWIKTYGVKYFSETTNTLLLMEEVGEFSRLVARVYGEQSFKKSEDVDSAHAQLADEWGDIFFVMLCLANQMGLDITAVMDKNLHKKTQRDAMRHRMNDKLK